MRKLMLLSLIILLFSFELHGNRNRAARWRQWKSHFDASCKLECDQPNNQSFTRRSLELGKNSDEL